MPIVCSFVGCQGNAFHNFKDEPAKFCHLHRKDGMVRVYECCFKEKCLKNGPYKRENSKSRWCWKHKTPDMKGPKLRNICKILNCDVHASYGFNGKLEFCSKHKPEKAKDNKHKKCQYKECQTSATFGIKKTKMPTHCSKHKSETMVPTCGLCKYLNCYKTANYNKKGESSVKYCSEHKTKDMITVSRKTCIEHGCEITANYNIKGKMGKLWCFNHAPVGAIVPNKPTCEIKNCYKTPTYNYKNQKKGIRCSFHKLKVMICLVSRTCSYKNCQISPSFNYKNRSGKWYCMTHKLDGMISVNHAYCNYCNTQAIFGYPGQKASLCSTHSRGKIGVIIHPRTRCINCKEFAIYGKRKQERCEMHKLKDDINLLERKCNECGVPNLLGKNDLCETCDPENKVRQTKYKENKIKELLLSKNLEYVQADKMIDSGACVKERPDFLYDCITHFCST